MMGVSIIKSILLRPNRYKDVDFSASVSVLDALAEKDCVIYVEDEFENSIPDNKAARMGKIVFSPLEKILPTADLCIVLGGDGSILDAVRRTAGYDIPIFGINLGRIGYMAEVEPGETEYLDRLFSGEYMLDERMMLEVTHEREGKIIQKSFALNDAVVSKGSVSKVVEIELYREQKKITRYRADGIIFATPTGSTAYSMSAGGPIIDPHIECICVTPVCPHSLGQRPLIFPKHAILCAKNISSREKELYLTLDGNVNFALAYGDTVQIKSAPYKARHIRVKDFNFYDTVVQKIKNMGE